MPIEFTCTIGLRLTMGLGLTRKLTRTLTIHCAISRYIPRQYSLLGVYSGLLHHLYWRDLRSQ